MKFCSTSFSRSLFPFLWFIVLDEGKLYTCGDGSFGQLGHGDYQLRCFPEEVLFFSDKHVDKIACGMRHSLALVKGI